LASPRTLEVESGGKPPHSKAFGSCSRAFFEMTDVLDDSRNLIDELLAEQQQLTAVERFARQHEQHELPAQARYYRSLIPLTKPGPGEQYAFAVDLDACTACKACVSACHSLNGLDEDEIWRNVGTIHGGTGAAAYQQTVTTACHHCVEPGCLTGCPVMAYEKDEATGIVRHLDDQCIGCEYCLLKCPYDVPKYSKRRGIVRKCDMCYQRLAADEAPACVQACPNEAIAIRLVEKAAVVAQAAPGVRLLPGAFESSYTKPTTVYTSRKEIPLNTRPANTHHMRLEHPHWPLIWMLLLSQLAAGLSVLLGMASFLPNFAAIAPSLGLAAFGVLQAGLLVSVFHLGKPLKAWRFFLGLRTSWMSREILVFSIFAGAAAAAAFACVLYSPVVSAMVSQLAPFSVDRIRDLAPLLGGASALTALAGIFCSGMIYIDTRRPAWCASATFPKFFGTSAMLGTAAGAVMITLLSKGTSLSTGMIVTAAAVALLHLGWEVAGFFRALIDEDALAHWSARTAWDLLRPQVEARAALLILGIAFLLAAIFSDVAGPVASVIVAFVLLFASAALERYCFFTACDAPRMPGGIST
jgi:Fe-S-cluster-containing dehydrogenase component/DMSO reductase anchor subunit